jgi:5-methyltetrahydrofolate--homocysteine methyltransferase
MKIIGEKINATRSQVRSIIEERREDELTALAQSQSAAGATIIDVNVGTGTGTQEDEIKSMHWAVEILCRVADKPLCIDSADPSVLAAGLEAMNGKEAMINSIKADDHYLREVLPLVAKYQVPVVALAMDDKGIPKTVEGRVDACRKIVSVCSDFQVPVEHLYFDPLVLPVSADAMQGKVTLDTLVAIKRTFPTASTTMGLSNISFGLPERAQLNAAFMQMAIFAGLDSAIMDPGNSGMMAAVRTAEALMGKDRHFRRYTRALRKS